jgi:hypothetical protein
MQSESFPTITTAVPLVHIQEQAPDRYTARVVGLPEVEATAATREQAIEQVRETLLQWLASGKLVSLVLPLRPPVQKPADWAEGDALEQEFLDDLARSREEDRERTLREDEQEDRGCSDTCSTPTT